jgi:Icc protein
VGHDALGTLDSMLIAQISDTHIFCDKSNHASASQRARCLSRCISDINLQQPDVVIFTGDTVQHGTPEEYNHLRRLLAPLKPSLYLVPGNRDNKPEMRAAFKDQPYIPQEGPFLHYTIDDYPIRLIALDSTEPEERKGVFCSERQEWLEKALKEKPDSPTILFIHHPPFDVGGHYTSGYRYPDQAIALTKLVSRHTQIKQLLCGHVHCLFRCDWAGTNATTMPSIAVDVRRHMGKIQSQQQPAYMLHRLTSESTLVSEIRVVE